MGYIAYDEQLKTLDATINNTTTNGTGIKIGKGSNRMAVFKITSATNAQNFTLVVEQSSDNAAWVIIDSFTFAGTGAAGLKKLGFVNSRQYVRASVTAPVAGTIVLKVYISDSQNAKDIYEI